MFAARGKRLCRRPPGAVLEFYDGGDGGGALGGHPSPSSSSEVRGGAPAEIKFSVFYPQNIPSEESKLNDFCGIWEHLKVKNDISALFCDLGGYIWEANLCVWGA